MAGAGKDGTAERTSTHKLIDAGVTRFHFRFVCVMAKAHDPWTPGVNFFLPPVTIPILLVNFDRRL